jgi:hypothetical protein
VSIQSLHIRRLAAMSAANAPLALRPLGDPSLFPIFEEANRLGAAVFVHPWDMAGQDLMKKYWLPWCVFESAATAPVHLVSSQAGRHASGDLVRHLLAHVLGHLREATDAALLLRAR